MYNGSNFASVFLAYISNYCYLCSRNNNNNTQVPEGQKQNDNNMRNYK